MNKKKKVVIIVAALFSIGVIAGLFFYDYSIHGNVVTAWAGTLSAFATVAIGVIAFIQNRNQQKRANEQSDLALMPDLYIQTALLERLSGFGNAVFNTVSAAINDNSIPKMSISIDFWFVKGPIVNLKAKEIILEGKKYPFSDKKGETFRNEEIQFRLSLTIPKSTSIKAEYLLVMSYENIYGTKYQKNIRFVVDPLNVISLERAYRV
ncbi:MAG: hypothetical protein J5756_00790 [Clostridia bacterium]|nr:hypothetical protein [Clostridia bacterium]